MNFKYLIALTLIIFTANKAFGAQVGIGEACDGTATTCATGYFCAPWGKVAPLNGNTCVKECTVADQDTQCGTNNKCEPLTTGGADLVCKTVLADLTVAPCTSAKGCDFTKQVCDEYTLTCVSKPETTTLPTTPLVEVTTTIKNIIGSKTPEPCVDLITGGPNDCRALAPYCTNDIYRDLMKAKCPRTCGYCSPIGQVSGSGCRDSSSDCSGKEYLCKSTIYKDLMKRECSMTCGYC